MLYVWKVTAHAVDETDAQIVAEVIEGAIADERNDPMELVHVTQRPASVDELRSFIAGRP